MADEKYSVGDVLFVISSTSNQVIPVQVIEEVHSKTLAGEKRTYIVQIGAQGAKPPREIEKLPKPIFRNTAEVQKYMLDNASQAINTMIKKAVASSNAWYKVRPDVILPPIDESDVSISDDDIGMNDAQSDNSSDNVSMVRLPDGSVARVKMQ